MEAVTIEVGRMIHPESRRAVGNIERDGRLVGHAVLVDRILIEFRRTALRHALLGETSSIDTASADQDQAGITASGDALILRVPARLKLCSGEIWLVCKLGSGLEINWGQVLKYQFLAFRRTGFDLNAKAVSDLLCAARPA